jgi:hypothetical protein
MSETKERPPLYPLVGFCLLGWLIWLALFLLAAALWGQPQDPKICGTVVPNCPSFEATMSRVFRGADCLAPPKVQATIDDMTSWLVIGKGKRNAMREVQAWAKRCGYRPLEPSTARTERVIR